MSPQSRSAATGADTAADTTGAVGAGAEAPPVASSRRRAVKLVLVVAIYAILLGGGSYAGHWFSLQLDTAAWARTDMIVEIIVTCTLLYIVLMALPFVPGVEIGVALILAFGAKVVPIVYIATIIALTISFTAGRLVPQHWLAALFRRLRMAQAERLIEELAPMSADERVTHLMRSAPRRWLPWLLRYRTWALALLLNLPGNGLIGGGGGIAMTVGISRLLSLPKFILAVAVGAAPVPLVVILAEHLELSSPF
jgi:hypothetical protein